MTLYSNQPWQCIAFWDNASVNFSRREWQKTEKKRRRRCSNVKKFNAVCKHTCLDPSDLYAFLYSCFFPIFDIVRWNEQSHCTILRTSTEKINWSDKKNNGNIFLELFGEIFFLSTCNLIRGLIRCKKSGVWDTFIGFIEHFFVIFLLRHHLNIIYCSDIASIRKHFQLKRIASIKWKEAVCRDEPAIMVVKNSTM